MKLVHQVTNAGIAAKVHEDEENYEVSCYVGDVKQDNVFVTSSIKEAINVMDTMLEELYYEFVM